VSLGALFLMPLGDQETPPSTRVEKTSCANSPNVSAAQKQAAPLTNEVAQ
jgi:hypothetical protein